jgi:hypothetical protein
VRQGPGVREGTPKSGLELAAGMGAKPERGREAAESGKTAPEAGIGAAGSEGVASAAKGEGAAPRGEEGKAVKAAERAEASTPAGEEATRGLGAPGGGAREREEPSSSTDPRGTRFRGEERTFEWAWFAGPREAPGETKAEGGPPTEDSGAAASLSRGVGAVEERVVVVKTRDLGIAMRETQKPGKGY